MKVSYLSILLAFMLVSCSKNEDQLLKEGRAAEDQKNFQLAVDRYQELVKRFPGGVEAESCQTRIALLYNNELHDFGNAVTAYKKVYELFPSSKNAPTSLFLAGFLLSNELHKLDSAKIVYEAFLQKYPNHELAASAKFELETMGKDPGEFIRRDEISSEDEKSETSAKTPKQ
jgi:TolA-binding protein